jgi:hypothetical protein
MAAEDDAEHPRHRMVFVARNMEFGELFKRQIGKKKRRPRFYPTTWTTRILLSLSAKTGTKTTLYANFLFRISARMYLGMRRHMFSFPNGTKKICVTRGTEDDTWYAMALERFGDHRTLAPIIRSLKGTFAINFARDERVMVYRYGDAMPTIYRFPTLEHPREWKVGKSR